MYTNSAQFTPVYSNRGLRTVRRQFGNEVPKCSKFGSSAIPEVVRPLQEIFLKLQIFKKYLIPFWYLKYILQKCIISFIQQLGNQLYLSKIHFSFSYISWSGYIISELLWNIHATYESLEKNLPNHPIFIGAS